MPALQDDQMGVEPDATSPGDLHRSHENAVFGAFPGEVAIAANWLNADDDSI